ncbi:uncharacterized protein LOC122069307 [Macadamia integrifolia]|uniref:uncharacterized protein LOC122069307 n=1 Tax=Macadamia integrifolia TaxID=60698 RepID=UPI001C4EB3E5|nr:uncharacterized protein LOC122069307 [Macadamia integrifolia]
MDALWKLEDKLKLSTQGAIIVFLGTAFAVIGLCTAIMKKEKEKEKEKKRLQRKQLLDEEEAIDRHWTESRSGWESIEEALINSVRWSEASKLELDETQALSWREGTPATLMVGGRYEAVSPIWQSHNSVSPVWHRPILMGEKCELPRFSGLILYDERGRPLHHDDPSDKEILLQEKLVMTVKDLL